MKLLTLNHLSLGYNHHTILNNLNLTINSDDFVCVVGPNGSGKTTLIRGILGELKPLRGTITFSKGLKPNFIGYLPQDTIIDPYFPASVLEIVLSGTLNRHRTFYSKTARQIALDNLKLLDIINLQNKSFANLSGGQRQKVLLARALSATTKLLILDEPSNNLDQSSKTELYETLQQINQNLHIAIIMVTHDLDHDNLIGNRILSQRS